MQIFPYGLNDVFMTGSIIWIREFLSLFLSISMWSISVDVKILQYKTIGNSSIILSNQIVFNIEPVTNSYKLWGYCLEIALGIHNL